MSLDVQLFPQFRTLIDVNAATFTDGKFAKWDAASQRVVGADVGTVTSVGLTVPSILSVTGSPVTGSGTLAVSLVNQSPNQVLAGPTSGGAATPAFRALVANDIPALDAAKITTGVFGLARGGTGITGTPANGEVLIGNGTDWSKAAPTGTANQVIVTLGSGSIAFSLPQSIHTAATPTFATLTLSSAPTADNHAATKAYVDAFSQGLDFKSSCRVATTGNITLSGAQTIDGVAVVAGDRVLVKNQSTGSQNGLYVAASGAWSRSPDADSSAEVTSGLYVFISEGTANASSGWVLTTPDPITLGTTSLAFTQFSGAGQITAGNGLAKSGNTLSVVAAPGGGLSVSGSGVAIDAAWTGQTSITTLGTIATGTWQGTVIGAGFGGTGVSTAAASTVFAGPTSGGSAAPSMRALVAGDIPNLDAAKIASGVFGIARGGTGVTAAPANGEMLLGDGSGWVKAPLTAGNQIGLTAGPGSLAIRMLGTVPCEGRLSPQASTAVPTGNVTGATAIRYVPYIGNRIALWSGSAWEVYQFTEITLAIGSPLTVGDVVDVFAVWNGTSLALEFGPRWTNSNTRFTNLAYQDGVLVLSGQPTRRYLGTIQLDSTTTTCSTRQKRFVWNYYHRVDQELYAAETGSSHTYSTATWREWAGSTSYRLEYVLGVLEDNPAFTLHGGFNGTADPRLAFGFNSTTSPIPPIGAFSVGANCGLSLAMNARRGTDVLLGYNYATALQYTGGSTGTYNQLQLTGSVRC